MAYYLENEYPKQPLIKIIENFHKIFDKQFIIKMNEKDQTKKEEWQQIEFGNVQNDQKPEWTILPPGKRTQNCLFNLNKSTEKIIRRQSKIGFYLGSYYFLILIF